jgi:hypothetical protein
MNAKQEFLNICEDKVVVCASITYDQWSPGFTVRPILLKCDYTGEEYKTFLDSLDFEYDCGYGSQELFGTIWFDDGTWATRGEYDGSEWWYINSRPEIPDSLK